MRTHTPDDDPRFRGLAEQLQRERQAREWAGESFGHAVQDAERLAVMRLDGSARRLRRVSPNRAGPPDAGSAHYRRGTQPRLTKIAPADPAPTVPGRPMEAQEVDIGASATVLAVLAARQATIGTRRAAARSKKAAKQARDRFERTKRRLRNELRARGRRFRSAVRRTSRTVRTAERRMATKIQARGGLHQPTQSPSQARPQPRPERHASVRHGFATQLEAKLAEQARDNARLQRELRERIERERSGRGRGR